MIASLYRVGQSLAPVADSLGGSLLEQSSSTEGDGAVKHVQVPLESDISSTGIEDVLEVVTKGYVKNCGPLNALCQEANFYQLYSKEYIQQLGDYLLKRTAARRLEMKTNVIGPSGRTQFNNALPAAFPRDHDLFGPAHQHVDRKSDRANQNDA